jgi:hypothetical protein
MGLLSCDLTGPRAAFVAVAFVGCIACAISSALLPAEAVLPLVASTFLGFGAGLALLSWKRPIDRSQVNYLDVAGALTLIGFFAAVAIEPEQLVRLVEGGSAN